MSARQKQSAKTYCCSCFSRRALVKGFYTDTLSHPKLDCGELTSEKLVELCVLAKDSWRLIP